MNFISLAPLWPTAEGDLGESQQMSSLKVHAPVALMYQ